MIAIGAHYRGPEFEGSHGISKILRATSNTLRDIRGPWIGTDSFGPCDSKPDSGPYFELGSEPAVNIVFFVPGSLGDFDISQIEVSKFSRKKQLVLISIPIPRDVVISGGSVSFVIDALNDAIRLSDETFKKKKVGNFDFKKAQSIVDLVKQSLLEQGF